jgi:hypothetical protein
MSLRSKIDGFLDKAVDGRFKRDSEGRLLFFPWGFGAGRIVPDVVVEQRLRQGCRWLTIGIFVVIVPILAFFNGFTQLKGVDFLWFMLGCVVVGFMSQLYPVWLSRGLVRSDERLSYAGAALQSLERFGFKFLVFGLITSVLFSAFAAVMLVFQPGGVPADPIAMAVSLVIFLPMALFYAVALSRLRQKSAGV